MRQVVEEAMRTAAGPAIGRTAPAQAPQQAATGIDDLLSKYGAQ